MMLAEIVFAGIADNKNDNGVFIQVPGDLERCSKVGSARTTTEDSFHATQLAGHLKRVAIGDVDDLVNVFDVHIWRHNFLTDSFNQVRRRFDDLPSLFVSFED